MITVNDVLELIRHECVDREETFLKSFPDEGSLPEPVHFFNHGAFEGVQKLLYDVEQLIKNDDVSNVAIPVTDAHYEKFKEDLGEYFHFVDSIDSYCIYLKDMYEVMFQLGRCVISFTVDYHDIYDFKTDLLISLENELICPVISQS